MSDLTLNSELRMIEAFNIDIDFCKYHQILGFSSGIRKVKLSKRNYDIFEKAIYSSRTQ